MPQDDGPCVLDRITGVAAFNSVISSEFVTVEVRSELEDKFVAGLHARTIGDLHFSHVRAAPHRIDRSLSSAALTKEPLLKLGVQIKGTGMVSQGGRVATIHQGDLFLQDMNQPYSLRYDDDCQMAFVVLREPTLAMRRMSIASLTARRIETDHGTAGSAADILRGMTAGFDHLDGASGRRVAGTLISLIDTMLLELGRGNGAVLDEATGRRTVTVRALRFIEERMGDPELDPAAVADACRVSVRYLHRLFAERGITIAGQIRETRLARCLTDLVDPAAVRVPVAVIAERAGFADASHFARAFRTMYGTTPTEYRRRALVEASAESQAECPV